MPPVAMTWTWVGAPLGPPLCGCPSFLRLQSPIDCLSTDEGSAKAAGSPAARGAGASLRCDLL
jgi:hypothetical protein